MSIMLENKQGLIAGDGILPVEMARHAKENGFEVICVSLANDNLKELKKYCSKVYSCHPGEMSRIEKIFTEEEIKQVTFLGKVHKRVLLQLHKFDKRAIEILKSVKRLNDDENFIFTSLGDIVISLETAAKQAIEYKTTFNEELIRLLTHGTLHLVGFDHEHVSKKEKNEMLSLQDKFIEKYRKLISLLWLLKIVNIKKHWLI